jgi:hypothetical protein
MVDDERWPFPVNPAAYFYPKAIHDVVEPYSLEEHQAMDLEFILAVVQALEPLYVDAVLGNMRRIEGTKTFNSIRDGSLGPIQRRIRAAAWKRASLRIKMRVAFLWMWWRPYCAVRTLARITLPGRARQWLRSRAPFLGHT